MKKIIAIVMGIAFAFGTAGYVAAQTPAPKADEKKADDKASDKMAEDIRRVLTGLSGRKD